MQRITIDLSAALAAALEAAVKFTRQGAIRRVLWEGTE